MGGGGGVQVSEVRVQSSNTVDLRRTMTGKSLDNEFAANSVRRLLMPREFGRVQLGRYVGVSGVFGVLVKIIAIGFEYAGEFYI